LTSFREDIGVALLTVHRHCRTVCMVDPVGGELRVRSVAVIAGVSNTVTVHREYGLWLKVDVASVYFSPRLASERKRVADLVGDREVVVDLFAGVAPFSIMIAKRGSPSGVIAIDKNPKAVQLAALNVRRNNVADVVDVVQGDAADVVGLVQGRKANRVIMNLPFGSFEFFSHALAIAAPRCVVHLYAILAEDMVSVKIEELRTCALRCSFELVDVDVRRIKSYAPYEFYMGFDIVAQLCADVA
jgi:tRNA (guanine37-N1)-methyltransferase